MKIIITIEDKNCNVEVQKEHETEKKSERNVSQYARFFDSGCAAWNEDPEYNLLFLKQQQNYANDLLKAKGHLFLNEVYDMLTIPRSKAGQVVGWVYNDENPIGDNRVDFGIYAEHNTSAINGFERSILLDFNVDGDILKYIDN